MKKGLKIQDYAMDINLYEGFVPAQPEGKNKEDLVDTLLSFLSEDHYQYYAYAEKRRVLHGIINTLQPQTLDEEHIAILDQLLQMELAEKPLTDTEELYVKTKMDLSYLQRGWLMLSLIVITFAKR